MKPTLSFTAALAPLAKEQEEWRELPWAPRYLISNLGRIWTKRFKKLLWQQKDRRGYWRTCLYVGDAIKGFAVSRLVCEAFHGPPPFNGAEAAHLDGEKTNNSASNLAWVTHVENMSHRVAHGTVLYGERHPNAKLKERDIPEILRAIDAGERKQDIADRYGVSRGTIRNVQIGAHWRTKELAA